MGANQSSSQGDAGPTNQAPTKTCYYDLLGVERLATDDEQVDLLMPLCPPRLRLTAS
jgi:hypothetical protein